VRIDEGGAGLLVVGVGVTRAGAGVPFDNDRVAPLDELVGGGGEQGDAMLLLFDFPGKSDDQDPAV
jgi:hypothetical protein